MFTAATSTPWFHRFHDLPFMRRTLYIGYGTRLGLSIAFPIGLGADLFPGMLSVRLAELLSLDPHGFAGTLIATIAQGTQLNIILALFMAALYGLQRALLKPPVYRPRGFDPIMPAQPVSAVAPPSPR